MPQQHPFDALTILLTIALSFIIALIENANESVKIFLDSADGFWIMAVVLAQMPQQHPFDAYGMHF